MRRVKFDGCLISLALIVLAPFVAGLGYLTYIATYVNPKFSAEYFAGIVPFERVIASRRLHGAAGWGCTYAIVTLEDYADDFPESWGNAEMWMPTPAPALGDTTRDALVSCRENWDPHTQMRLVAALSETGSFYWRDGVGQDLWIYSRRVGIAAKIRFGD